MLPGSQLMTVLTTVDHPAGILLVVGIIHPFRIIVTGDVQRSRIIRFVGHGHTCQPCGDET